MGRSVCLGAGTNLDSRLYFHWDSPIATDVGRSTLIAVCLPTSGLHSQMHLDLYPFILSSSKSWLSNPSHNLSPVNNDKLQPVVLHESPPWTLHFPGHPGILRYMQYHQRYRRHESFFRMRFVRLSTRELQRTRNRSAS